VRKSCGLSKALAAIVAGGIAGAAGTAAMDALLYYRYRSAGGDSSPLAWEFGARPTTWEEAPAPARAGKVLLEAVGRREIPIERAAALTNAMHWGYGPAWGANYGIVVRCVGAPPAVLAGLSFGATVFASDYVTLPLLKVYKPIWEYDRAVLRDDLTAHLVYGVATALAFPCVAAALRRN
jgi:hypothetical protein